MGNAKLGVDIGQFKSGIDQAKASLKTLNAEMKANEAQFKKTGNSEQYLTQKSKTLNSQITQQKAIIDQATAALKKMADAGVDPADAAYQRLSAQLLNAQAGMYEAETALKALDGSQQQAAVSAEQLTQGMNGISKKISLDQVITGIDKITSGLENAAKKAVKLGQDLWDSIMDTAAWSDDVGTLADRMGLSTDQVQRMMAVAGQFEAPVESMAKTWKKLRKNMDSDSKEMIADFEKLGVATHDMIQGKNGNFAGAARDYIDVFWEVGEALMNMSDASEQERIAQSLLGRSWDELIPLFMAGRQAYEDALAGVETASEDAIRSNAELNDAVAKLESSFQILKAEVLGKLAPELTKVVGSLDGLLESLTEYLKSDEGQEFLKTMGEAVGALFDDLTKIDPKSVVKNFTEVFTTLTSGLQWIVSNKEKVIGALEVIVAGWAGLKITGGALTIIKLIDGLKGLGIGGGAAASGASATGGASWFSNAIAAGSSRMAGLQLAAGNGVPVMDWFMNTTAPGRQFSNWITGIFGGKPQFAEEDVIGDFTRNIERNASTFATDWTGVMGNIVGAFDKLFNGEDKPKVEVEPEAPENAAEDISKQVGDVTIPVTLLATGLQMMGGGAGGGGGAGYNILMKKANGIPYVPYDGYLAMLHQGERVVPARENLSRNFSSNLYIESMYMNSGMDADGLAAAIAARNQRIMAGFGS